MICIRPEGVVSGSVIGDTVWRAEKAGMLGTGFIRRVPSDRLYEDIKLYDSSLRCHPQDENIQILNG
jgi:hypothetical protein